jgi:UDP-N-acetylmuramoyl-tripeptide--D-alanyl-D-alanine ligase
MSRSSQSRPVLWTAADAAAATSGKAGGAWKAYGVSIDSRTLTAGDLFVAIKGPRFDGHDFVAEALAKGAAAAVVARLPENVASAASLLLVADPMAALEDRERWQDRGQGGAAPRSIATGADRGQRG